jgi:hypothetical protein
MESAMLAAPPHPKPREPRLDIPLSLLLPALCVALVTAALVAAALLLAPGSHIGPPQALGADKSGAAAAAQGALQARYEAARASFEGGQQAEAFGHLAALADAGHCDSARLALQLMHAGPEAYMSQFNATPAQVASWRRLQGCGPTLASR